MSEMKLGMTPEDAYILAVGNSKKYTDEQLNNGIFVGYVTNGGTMPTQRPDGSALKNEDYCRPNPSSTFPFTIGTCTFENKMTRAFYYNATWIVDAGAIQDTAETPLRNQASESLSGTSAFQSQLNVENKAEFAKKLNLDKLNINGANVNNTTATVIKAPVNYGTAGQVLATNDTANGLEWVKRLPDVDDVTVEFNTDDEIQIKDLGVSTAKLQDLAVTTPKIGNQSVTTVKIADVAVTTEKIADSAVTTAKIADVNVTTAKIADSAVTTPKIADANVTTAKIADANVTTAKIADDAVTTAKILNSNVTTAKIADLNVTTEKIAEDAVTIDKVADANISTAIPSTGAVNTKLATEKAVDDFGKVDNTTIERHATNGMQIKNGGVTFAKIANQGTGNAGKKVIVGSDGVLTLENIVNPPTVTATVVPDTITKDVATTVTLTIAVGKGDHNIASLTINGTAEVIPAAGGTITKTYSITDTTNYVCTATDTEGNAVSATATVTAVVPPATYTCYFGTINGGLNPVTLYGKAYSTHVSMNYDRIQYKYPKELGVLTRITGNGEDYTSFFARTENTTQYIYTQNSAATVSNFQIEFE